MATRKSKTVGINPLDALSREAVVLVTESSEALNTKNKTKKSVTTITSKGIAKKRSTAVATDDAQSTRPTIALHDEPDRSSTASERKQQEAFDAGIQHPSLGSTSTPSSSATSQSVEALFEQELHPTSVLGDEPAPSAQIDQSMQPKVAALIKTWSQWSAVGAIAPSTVLSYGIVFGIQIKMIHALCKHYDVEFQHHKVIVIASGLVGGTINSGLAQLVNATLVKNIPVVGSIAGYFADAGLSYAVTYALGYSFAKHFEEKGTLSTFKADRMKEYFLQQVANGKALFKNKNAVIA
jgi:uncharacterized protein (DUF697 family)